jgi:integrase
MKGSVKKEGSTWYYLVDLGKDPITGKRKRRRKRGFKTKKDAEQALSKVIYEVNNGTFVEPSKTLFKDYFKEWLEGKRHNYSRQTVKNYESYLLNHISPVIGHIPLSNLTSLMIQNFIGVLRHKGLADGTVRRIFNVVNTSLNNAEKMQIIPKNPATLVDKPQVKQTEMKVWEISEVRRFLEVAKDSRYYMAFHLAITTGMRQGEILGLRWKDIDLHRGIVYVRQTLDHDGKDFKAGAKTKSGVRSINLDPHTVEALKSHRIMIAEERLKLGKDYKDNDLVVCTYKGTVISPRNLTRTWHSLIKKADLPKIRFHDLRHTHASLMLQQGEHVKVVSERLGHNKIQITLDTYSHVMPNMQEESANRFGEMVFKDNAL